MVFRSMGSSTSSTGDNVRLTSSQSSTVIVPSWRSVMICKVKPLSPERRARTRRKPIDCKTGSIIEATRASMPVSVIIRSSVLAAGTVGCSVLAPSVTQIFPVLAPRNKKERDLCGPTPVLSTKNITSIYPNGTAVSSAVTNFYSGPQRTGCKSISHSCPAQWALTKCGAATYLCCIAI